MSDHPLQCRCGKLAGSIAHAEKGVRGTCYCRHCQAYAHSLGNPKAVLDDLGGTDIVATVQENVRLTRGTEALACLSLSESGLLRWYASCCNTPIANTTRDPKLSYVGLVHTCLGPTQRSLDAVFGATSVPANTMHAKGNVATRPLGMFGFMIRMISSVAWARLRRSYRQSPFFEPVHGKPVVVPRVLTKAERKRAMKAV